MSGRPNPKPRLWLSRRSFLQVGAASCLGLSLADALRADSPDAAGPAPRRRAKSVILVWLGGGPATIDMWDMKPQAPLNIRGEFQPINTKAAGLKICEHLPQLAKVMDRCVIVRSVSHTIAAHGPGASYLLTGNRPNPALQHPSLGSLAAKLLPERSEVPSYMTLGRQANSGAGFLGAAYNPFESNGLDAPGAPAASSVSLPNGFSPDDLDRRENVLREFDRHFQTQGESEVSANLSRFQQRAIDILKSQKTKQALDLSSEEQAVKDSYGASSLGRGLLTARRLIDAGVRFVTVGLSGWDTHANNFGQLRSTLLPQLDRALSALIVDLEQRGLLEETILYCTGEFARTPSINGAAGRDHWARAMAPLLAGGGLKRGYVHGSTDQRGNEPESHRCSPDDVSATIFHQLGIPSDTKIYTPSGRPTPVFRDGRVLRELFS